MAQKMNYQITAFSHSMAEPFIKEGDLCIDATMGNGHDTQFLCQCVGEHGHVIAFDIQQQALLHTNERLKKAGISETQYELHKVPHEHMAEYAKENSVSCIFFNLGYLPGADHRLATQAASTIEALQSALTLLKKGGAVIMCVYSGGDSGYEEKDAVLGWLQKLNSRDYLVMVTQYWNRENDPPIPVLIIKK